MTQSGVSFMPWCRVGKPIQVGPVTFFDYPGDGSPHDLAEADRCSLDSLKSAYRTWPEQDEVTSLVVATFDTAHPLRTATDDERALVQRAVYALAFSCLAYGYHHPYLTCCADNFILYHQNFDPSTDAIAVESGRALQHFTDSTMVRFVRPTWLLDLGAPVQPAEEFLKPLSAVIEQDDPGLRRLWLAIESYVYALTDHEMSRPIWRYVHLAIAFEALLNFSSRSEFVRKIGLLCRPYEYRARETVELFRSKGPQEYSIVQIWAAEFYDIRNDLVHGKPDFKVPVYWRDVRRHLEIANHVFRMCVRERLAEHVPGPAARGGQPIRLADCDFEEGVLDDQDPAVVHRRSSAKE